MPDKKAVKIVAFGDSITLAMRQPKEKRWVGVLAASLNKSFPDCQIEVINSGVGGNTSREGLERIEKDVLDHNPDLVLIEFGGNDATEDETRHVESEEFRANLETMCTRITETCNAKVALLTFPPVIDEWHVWGGKPFFEPWGGVDKCVEGNRKITRDFAAEKGLVLIDIDKALREHAKAHGPEDCILPDGIHLTATGNQVVADAIIPAVEKIVAVML